MGNKFGVVAPAPSNYKPEPKKKVVKDEKPEPFPTLRQNLGDLINSQIPDVKFSKTGKKK